MYHCRGICVLLFSAASLPAKAGQQVRSVADTQQGPGPVSSGTRSVSADGRAGSVAVSVHQATARWHRKSSLPVVCS